MTAELHRTDLDARNRLLLVLGLSLGLLLALVIAAGLVTVPYKALRPGSVRPVAEHVLIEGAPSHPPDHSIAFTTVGVGNASLLEALGGWLDPTVDLFPREVIEGDRDAEENRRYNAELMDVSKLTATTVALRHLGLEVTLHTTGTVVRQIAEGTPAAAVLQQDDVIVAVDGEPIDAEGELSARLQEGGVGGEHVLTVERPPGSGQVVEVPITTIADPADPARAIIGVAGQERYADVDLPFEVTIDTGRVGGPSAGLAFALTLIDLLTPGNLTGDLRVAVTGTIDMDGNVGVVGGAAQKAVAVRDEGYDVFLVPEAEAAEVRAAIGDDLRVVAVGTLSEALQALAALGGTEVPTGVALPAE